MLSAALVTNSREAKVASAPESIMQLHSAPFSDARRMTTPTSSSLLRLLMVYARLLVGCIASARAVELSILFDREGTLGAATPNWMDAAVGIDAPLSCTEEATLGTGEGVTMMMVAAGLMSGSVIFVLPVGAAALPAGSVAWLM